jgi:hypothetical protein
MHTWKRVLVGSFIGFAVGPGYRAAWNKLANTPFAWNTPLGGTGWLKNAVGGAAGGGLCAGFAHPNLAAVIVTGVVGGAGGAAMADMAGRFGG